MSVISVLFDYHKYALLLALNFLEATVLSIYIYKL